MKTKTITLTLILIGMLCLSSGMNTPIQAQDPVTYLFSNINELRASLGVAPYSLNGTLSVAAQNHASWMAQTGQVSHTQPDGSTPSSRAQAAGYQSSWVSENIYMGTSATAQSAWQWWLNSPIHYRGITNPNYAEVGIASATGPAGQAFVLVFGNPSGSWNPPASSSGSSNSSGAVPGLPPYVVGLDSFGNIMHEIQPGHTLGDIALIYGYTWDDLQYIRDLNTMTEEEGRNLEIGSILLVPPQAGTYTPTPVPSDYTPPAPVSIEEMQRVDNPTASTPTLDFPVITIAPPTAIPSPSPMPTGSGLVVTSAVVPEWAVATEATSELEALVDMALNYTPDPNASPSPAWQAMTVTPASTSVAMVSSDPNAGGAGLIEPAIVEVSVDEEDSAGGTSPLLYGAIVLQSLIILGAGVAFWRQNRK